MRKFLGLSSSRAKSAGAKPPSRPPTPSRGTVSVKKAPSPAPSPPPPVAMAKDLEQLVSPAG